jgi:hypothetical protein
MATILAQQSESVPLGPDNREVTDALNALAEAIESRWRLYPSNNPLSTNNSTICVNIHVHTTGMREYDGIQAGLLIILNFFGNITMSSVNNNVHLTIDSRNVIINCAMLGRRTHINMYDIFRLIQYINSNNIENAIFTFNTYNINVCDSGSLVQRRMQLNVFENTFTIYN